MSHYERVKCSHCINGFVMTGVGPKPCMYCHGKGYTLVEVEDEDDYVVSDKSDYSESNSSESYSGSYDYDDEENTHNSDTGVRPLGCIATLVIFFVVIKYALIPADWGQIGPYIAIAVLLAIGAKLSFRD